MSPKQLTREGVVVKVGGFASGTVTDTVSEQVVFVSVIVISYNPAGTPENTFPARLIEAGFGLIP